VKVSRNSCKRTEYKGVLWITEYRKFKASITEKGVRHPCGYYKTAREAAMARDLAIIKFRLDPKKLQILKSVNHEQNTLNV